MKKYYYIAAAILISLFIFFYFFGRYLVVNETPSASDAIILLSGDDGRLETAASLMEMGYADRMIVTRTNGREGFDLDTVVRFVPRTSVIPEYRADSTYTNAVFSKELMIQNGFKSALVVSSNYHMRRVKYIFEKVYRDSGIELKFVAAPSEHFNPNKWWTKKMYIKYAVSEYTKLFGYIVLY